MRALYVLISAAVLSGAPWGSYQASIEKWRLEREQRLKASDGWLTVAGLFWLQDGENRAGSDPSSEIALPEGRAPARVGVFDYRNGKTRFRATPGLTVTVNLTFAVGAPRERQDLWNQQRHPKGLHHNVAAFRGAPTWLER